MADPAKSASEHRESAESGAQGPFDPAEHLSLYKFKVVTEIKDEIVGWAQVRLAILTTLLSFIILTGSFVGIKLLVEAHIERIARGPVEARIKVLQEAGEQAKQRVESLRIQSDQVNTISAQTQLELSRLKGEADILRRFVKDTEPEITSAIKNMERVTKEFRAEANRIKEGATLSSQYFQEQALKSKADILQMRNNVELLHAGFAIIEKLATEIRQAEPQSELAQQFASFEAQWRAARMAHEKRAGIIKARREIKIILYLREDAPQEHHRLSQHLVDALLAEGYTAEVWWTKRGVSDIEAAVIVGKEFGIDAKSILNPAVILDPNSPLDVTDLTEIAKKAGVVLPAVTRLELAPEPQAPKTNQILAGGENGMFKASSVVLIAELGDGKQVNALPSPSLRATTRSLP